MHELSVVAGLFELLEEQVREHHASAVTRVKLRVGEMSGIVPELLESAFEVYKKGTLAEAARLEVEIVPVRIRCGACGGETLKEEDATCASCGARDFSIEEGRDLLVERIEIETEDP